MYANSGDRAHSFLLVSHRTKMSHISLHKSLYYCDLYLLAKSRDERGQKCEGSVSLVSRFIEMGDQLNFIYPKSIYRYKFWISLNQLSDYYTCREIL